MNDILLPRFLDFFRAKVPPKSATRGNGRFAAGTSVGLVRSQNEDRCAIIKARFGGAPARDFNVGVVCDGLGGMDGGQEAASLGLATFLATLIQSTRPSPTDRLYDAVMAANERIFGVLKGRGGTTLTAVMITRHHGTYLCHVGDSRLFAVGPERILQQMTRDDTLGALLQKPSPDVRRDSRLLQFVGMGSEMEPQVDLLPWRHPSSYLLTSDGAHDVPSSIMERVVVTASSPLDLSRKLIQLSEMLGGFDNASVVMLPSKIEDEPARPDTTELAIMLPAEEFAIWLPVATTSLSPTDEKQTNERTPSLGSDEPVVPKKMLPSDKTKTATKKPRKKTTKGKGSGGELPLETKRHEVNVEFQNDRRGQG